MPRDAAAAACFGPRVGSVGLFLRNAGNSSSSSHCWPAHPPWPPLAFARCATAQLESTLSQLAELEEEHGGDDGVFSGYDKINAAAVKDRVKEAQAKATDAGAQAELAVLQQWLKLQAAGAALKKQHKDAETLLDQQAHDRYASLTAAEVKTLVVNDKWMAALAAALHGETDRISQQLTQRVKQLAKRYATPLPDLSARVAALQAQVDGHLRKMGFTTA